MGHPTMEHLAAIKKNDENLSLLTWEELSNLFFIGGKADYQTA